MSNAACTNPICAQFRIQHKNVTIKRLELEKELELMRRAQSNQFNQAVAQRAVTPVRDAVTRETGLMMPNGEVMTPEKIKKQMEIAAKCMESLQMSEKLNRQLAEENKNLKLTNERSYNEIRRLEKALNWFEKSRKYDTFTDEKHKETLKINEQMADELDELEHKMHILEEENAALRRNNHRSLVTAERTFIEDDEDMTSISSYITSDGRIPSKCPCDPERCMEWYETNVVQGENQVQAFTEHMRTTHKVSFTVSSSAATSDMYTTQCAHCKQVVKGAKQTHETTCSHRKTIKIPKKKHRRLEDEPCEWEATPMT